MQMKFTGQKEGGSVAGEEPGTISLINDLLAELLQ
jgi:hypothetical protein